MTSKMPGWVLVLDPPSGDPLRRVGGLPLALRLALDAQAGDASAIVIAAGAEAARYALSDPRLSVPVLDAVPPDAQEVRAPASLLVHRAQFKQLVEASALPRDLGKQPFHVDAPWAFSAVDVKDDRIARVAEAALFRSLRKREDGWTSRFVNRYISLAISRLLVKTPLTPNQVSIAILAIGIAGAVLAAKGTYLGLLAGAFLFQMQSVLDGCDGEMSRITHRGSVTGEWLDTIGDDVTNYGFFGAAAWGLHAQTGNKLYLAAGAVTIACGVLASGIEYRYLMKIGSGDLLKYPLSASTSSGGAFDKIRPLFKRDTFVLLTLLSAVAGLVGPMLLVFAVAAVGVLASVIAAELRMARERREGRAS
jgi:phosphatidylglycerophosphate synthase